MYELLTLIKSMFHKKQVYKLKQTEMMPEMSHARTFADVLLNKINYYQNLAIRKNQTAIY